MLNHWKLSFQQMDVGNKSDLQISLRIKLMVRDSLFIYLFLTQTNLSGVQSPGNADILFTKRPVGRAAFTAAKLAN